jgi:hypothetical protein
MRWGQERVRLATGFVVAVAAAAAVSASGCQPGTDAPVTFVSGLRVLAIKAEPPQIAPGGSTAVTAFVVGTGAETPTVAWSRCRRPPLPGEGVSPDCVTNVEAPYLEPIGGGLTITTAMPADVTADALGAPDASGGVYLPLVARVAAGADAVVATYRLRLFAGAGGASGEAANRNPAIAGVLVAGASGTSPLDEAVPLVVHAGDRLTLTATFAAGSAEAYVSPSSPGAPVAEVLTTSWFASAGDFSNERTSDQQPDTELRLDQRLPAPGTAIDVWAVARDERGGADWVHRVLELE